MFIDLIPLKLRAPEERNVSEFLSPHFAPDGANEFKGR